MSEQVSLLDQDKIYARKVLAAFYDENFAARFDTINEEVIEILGEMISRSSDCSEWMDYVPKPVTPLGVKPGIKWSIRQVRKIGKALLNTNKKHKFTCVTAVGWGFRGQLERAALGL